MGGLLLHSALVSSVVPCCGVLLVRILSIVARFILAVIALRKERPEQSAEVISAAFPRWRRR